MGPFVGALLGAGNALVQNPATAQAVAEAVDPNAVAMRQKLKEDTLRMQQGRLGPSQAQRASWLGDFSRVAAAQQANQQANIARQAAAAGPATGAYAAAQQAAAQATQDAVRQQAGAIDQMSAQLAEREKADIQARQEAQRQRLWSMWGIGAPAGQETSMAKLPGQVVSGGISGAMGAKSGATGKALAAAYKPENTVDLDSLYSVAKGDENKAESELDALKKKVAEMEARQQPPAPAAPATGVTQ